MIDTGKQYLSVGNDILALALINIQDIFKFTLTAKDNEIGDRYGSEECAVRVAEKYLNIARDAIWLEKRISGWSMNYSMPIKDSDERVEKIARFYDVKESEDEE